MITLRRLDVTSAVAVAGFAAWVGLSSIPLDWFWFRASHFTVTNGAHPLIDIQREILRPVQMKYTVTIRRIENRTVVCQSGAGPFTYDHTALLPDEITLEWWAPSDRRCHELQAGTYTMETCWTALLGWLPDKTLCLTSNPFTVPDEPRGKPRSLD